MQPENPGTRGALTVGATPCAESMRIMILQDYMSLSSATAAEYLTSEPASSV
jgi:hypothetical protein